MDTSKVKKTKQKRLINKHETLNKYEKRITQLIQNTITDDDRSDLDNSYLSTYECYSTITQDFDNKDRQCNSAVVLMRVLRGMGINIAGVTSERTKHGEYVAQNRQNLKAVYVGKHMYFTNKKSHKWRILPEDRVYF